MAVCTLLLALANKISDYSSFHRKIIKRLHDLRFVKTLYCFFLLTVCLKNSVPPSQFVCNTYLSMVQTCRSLWLGFRMKMPRALYCRASWKVLQKMPVTRRKSPKANRQQNTIFLFPHLHMEESVDMQSTPRQMVEKLSKSIKRRMKVKTHFGIFCRRHSPLFLSAVCWLSLLCFSSSCMGTLYTTGPTGL